MQLQSGGVDHKSTLKGKASKDLPSILKQSKRFQHISARLPCFPGPQNWEPPERDGRLRSLSGLVVQTSLDVLTDAVSLALQTI